MMKSLRSPRFLAILGIAALSACDDMNSPSAPELDDLMLASEEMELALLADESAIETAIEIASTNTTVALHRGRPAASNSGPLAERARVRFRNAQVLLDGGDRRGALDEARQARRLVVQGVQAAGGDDAVKSLVERIEDLSISVVDESADYVAVNDLSADLSDVAAAARTALDRGDLATAGERAILGEQRARRDRGQNGRRGHVTEDRAGIEVEMAAHAIVLAERLIGDAPTDEQLRFLDTAAEFLATAREALGAGEFGRAIHSAHLATWHALKAVVLPDGVTEEEARAMIDLAHSLLIEARAAVGDGGSEIELSLLERAARLVEAAEDHLANGKIRGIGAAWRSAVISSYLIG